MNIAFILLILSVDRFAEERYDEVALAAPEEAAVAIVIVPVETVTEEEPPEMLPTTASSMPLLALLGALMLSVGLLVRGVRTRL